MLNNFNKVFKFLFACANISILSYFIKNFFLYFKIISKSGLKNYLLFFLFDIVSLKFFINLTKNKNLNFSLIFLNSLAHFQHNNWDEKENHYIIKPSYSEKVHDNIFEYNSAQDVLTGDELEEYLASLNLLDRQIEDFPGKTIIEDIRPFK